MTWVSAIEQGLCGLHLRSKRKAEERRLTANEHAAALAAITVLMGLDPRPETTLGRALVILSDAVEDYEKHHFPMFAP